MLSGRRRRRKSICSQSQFTDLSGVLKQILARLDAEAADLFDRGLEAQVAKDTEQEDPTRPCSYRRTSLLSTSHQRLQ